MRKKLVLLLLAGVVILGVSACGKEDTKKEKAEQTVDKTDEQQENQISTMEIIQFGLGETVETKDDLKITLNSIEVIEDDELHSDSVMYSLDITIEALSEHKDIEAGELLVGDEAKVSDETVSFKDNKVQNIKLKFCIGKDIKITTFTYTGDASKLWNIELPDLSTVSTT